MANVFPCEEGQNCPIGRKGDGHYFLECAMCNLQLLGEGKSYYYADLLGRFNVELKKNSSIWQKKEVVPSR